MVAREVDVRFEDQIIVRPASIAGDPSAGAARRNHAG